MGSSVSKSEDKNNEDLAHSGHETNIGFFNFHSETVNHGIKMISVLTFLAMIVFIIWKCSPFFKNFYKRCIQRQQTQYSEYQQYLAQNRIGLDFGRGDPIQSIRISQPIPNSLQCLECQQQKIQSMQDKEHQTDQKLTNYPVKFQESMV